MINSCFLRRRSGSASLVAAMLLMGCYTGPITTMPSVTTSTSTLPSRPEPQVSDAQRAQEIENTLDTVTALQVRREGPPPIQGIGYAVVSSQPAKSINQRRLMAIRAARLEAMRNLTEQIHGIAIGSRTTVLDAVVQNDTLRATVQGVIRGARTVRINPVGSDTYEVLLEIDRALIEHILKAARRS